MAVSTATITYTFAAGSQAAADTLRDNAMRDFALAKGLNIYQADGITIDPTKISPAVRAFMVAEVKRVVVDFRTDQARATEFAAQSALALT
jgi:hypothetical protein